MTWKATVDIIQFSKSDEILLIYNRHVITHLLTSVFKCQKFVNPNNVSDILRSCGEQKTPFIWMIILLQIVVYCKLYLAGQEESVAGAASEDLLDYLY